MTNDDDYHRQWQLNHYLVEWMEHVAFVVRCMEYFLGYWEFDKEAMFPSSFSGFQIS